MIDQSSVTVCRTVEGLGCIGLGADPSITSVCSYAGDELLERCICVDLVPTDVLPSVSSPLRQSTFPDPSVRLAQNAFDSSALRRARFSLVTVLCAFFHCIVAMSTTSLYR